MGKPILLMILVLTLLASACRGATEAPQATEASAPATEATVAAPKPVVQNEATTLLEEAYTLLVRDHVDPVPSGKLLQAGLDAVSAELIRGGAIGAAVEKPKFSDDPAADWELFSAAFTKAVNRYGSKVNESALAHAAIRAMAESVDDCHTTFMSPRQFEEQMRWASGEVRFGGIGASLWKRELSDPLVITHVFDGTPAAQAGLRAGDVILAVDGQGVAELSVDQVVRIVRGPEGKTVALTIQRGDAAPQVFTITRAAIEPPAVEAKIYEGNIGYLRIHSFPATVIQTVDRALNEFKRHQVRALVVDVRNNGGGLRDAMTQTTSRFVKDGLIFYLYDREGQRTDFVADGTSYRGLDVPMVVLVNESSGSGAELFAAALQEQGIATVVGARTSGCVGTGRLFPLSDGSALQITNGRVLTGQRDRMLNRVGLTPDQTVPMSTADLVAGRDPQLDRAFGLILQRAGS